MISNMTNTTLLRRCSECGKMDLNIATISSYTAKVKHDGSVQARFWSLICMCGNVHLAVISYLTTGRTIRLPMGCASASAYCPLKRSGGGLRLLV